MTSYSLYVQVPFCPHGDRTCREDSELNLDGLIPDYVTALCREVDTVAHTQPDPLTLTSVYFGGGTPSVLSRGQLGKIIHRIRQHFELEQAAEVTLEVMPGTVSKSDLQVFKEVGFNRISLEMAAIYPPELDLLGKPYGVGDVITAVQWIRESGFDNLNLDTVYGLPGQTMAGWEQTLDMALNLGPDHISVYEFAPQEAALLEKWVQRGLLTLTPRGRLVSMYQLAVDCLRNGGYRQYEISSWAKGGYQCRHNLTYWRFEPYLGLGAGAEGFAAGVRTMNIPSPRAYVQSLLDDPWEVTPFPRTPATRMVDDLTPDEEMDNVVLMGLHLTEEGVSRGRFQERFNRKLGSVYGDRIRRLVRQGLLEWSGDALRISSKGKLYSRWVLSSFLSSEGGPSRAGQDGRRGSQPAR